MAWPGPQEGLGQGGPRLKWAKGRFGSKNNEKVKVLRMEFSIVENLSGLQESIFNLSRGPQLHFGEKSKNYRILLKLPISPLSPCSASLGLLSFVCPQTCPCRDMADYRMVSRERWHLCQCTVHYPFIIHVFSIIHYPRIIHCP